MKLDKDQQKQIMDEIAKISSEKRYNLKKNTIYFIKDNAFIYCDFLIVNSQKLVYRIYIKNYDYDDIFWKVMHMPDNSKKNDSLRAVGAFKAPSILLNKGEIEFGDNYLEQAQFLVTLIDESSCSFLGKYDIDDYVINLTDVMYINILKYLAYIHMNNEFEANIIAKKAVNDDAVDFINEGKSFFEWALTE